jgi:hypothetical protein
MYCAASCAEAKSPFCSNFVIALPGTFTKLLRKLAAADAWAMYMHVDNAKRMEKYARELNKHNTTPVAYP